MNCLLTPGRNELTIQSFEKMLTNINLKSSLITVDLRQIKFIDPYGLVNLLLLAKWLFSYTTNIFYVLPESIKVNSYLQRMKFWYNVKDYVHFYPHLENNLKKQKINSSDVLLELTPIKKEDDVASVVQIIVDRIHQVIAKKLHISPEIATKFSVCLAELCQNIPQHSGDWGFAAAQTYHYNGQPFLKLAVGDLGIGIKKSLWNSSKQNWLEDKKAILAATELGISRYGEIGRGLGLSQVKKYVIEFNGKMYIRSGQARLFFSKEKQVSLKTPYFPGTQISIELPGNN
jgi:hypothetical protein